MDEDRGPEAAVPPRKRITQAEQRRIRAEAKRRFNFAHKVERVYGARLRSVARQIGMIVEGMRDQSITTHTPLVDSLRRYAEVLRPWAHAVSTKMAIDVARHDQRAWRGLAADMGVTLRHEQMASQHLEDVIREMTNRQVESITTLPITAAKRVQELAVQGVFAGQRAQVIKDKLRGVVGLVRAHAATIARTATSSAASAVVQARSKVLGSTAYIWRSAEDGDVRPLHDKLDGKVFRWDDPPVIGENGERGHPGEIYNCRCYPEPILPD